MRSLALGFILVATCCLVCCKSTGSRKNVKNLRLVYGPSAPSGIEDSLATPPHHFSRKEYPFDSAGNYREDWVSGGGGSETQTADASPSASESTDGTSRYHVVTAEDTLFGLSRTYGVTLYALRQANQLSGYTIRPGQRLKIPAQ